MNHTQEKCQIKVVDWIFGSLLFSFIILKLVSAHTYTHLKTVSECLANALTEHPASTRWHGRTPSKSFGNKKFKNLLSCKEGLPKTPPKILQTYRILLRNQKVFLNCVLLIFAHFHLGLCIIERATLKLTHLPSFETL